MIKVLLADDEPFIRQGLKVIIDWNYYGYEVVAEAGNALEAIQILKKEAIDLAIVDIKMPGMTGLELIGQIRTFSEKTRVAILSGYSDFSYAKEAISLHVDAYLLKPVQKEELIAFLQSTAEKFNHNSEDGKVIVERMATYTRQHYAENLSLVSMGERFHMNNVYLGQLFKTQHGMTYKEFLSTIRMEEAVRLLENTDMKIYDVAEKTGFQGVDYFIKKFTQIKGITPKQYRIQHRKEPNG